MFDEHKFTILFYFSCFIYVHATCVQCLRHPEEGAVFSGAGVTGCGELPSVGGGDQSPFAKAASFPNFCTLSPASEIHNSNEEQFIKDFITEHIFP